MARKAPPTAPFWRKRLPRKRLRPADAEGEVELAAPPRTSSSAPRSGGCSRAFLVSVAVSGGYGSGRSSPWTPMIGGLSAVMCRSEPPRFGAPIGLQEVLDMRRRRRRRTRRRQRSAMRVTACADASCAPGRVAGRSVAARAQSAMVTRRTSSIVVTPCRILSSPLWRSVVMPRLHRGALDLGRRGAGEDRSRISSLIGITS